MDLFLLLVCYILPMLVTISLWVALMNQRQTRQQFIVWGVVVSLVPFLNILAVVALGNMLVGIPRPRQ